VEFYDPTTAPDVFDIVWCKWPRREDKLGPGPWVRAVLVLDVRLMVDSQNENEWAAVTAAYGTGAENVKAEHFKGNLLITAAECGLLGLHKATVFKLDPGSRKRLPWAEDYFVPQGYVLNQGIVAGSLSAGQQTIVKACLKERGLAFPLP